MFWNYNLNILGLVFFLLIVGLGYFNQPKLQLILFLLVFTFSIARIYKNLLRNIISFYREKLNETKNRPILVQIVTILGATVARFFRIPVLGILGIAAGTISILIMVFCWLLESGSCQALYIFQGQVGDRIQKIINNPYFIPYVIFSLFIGYMFRLYFVNSKK